MKQSQFNHNTQTVVRPFFPIVSAALAILAFLIPTIPRPAAAEGFPRGHQQALGTNFHAAPNIQPSPRRYSSRCGTNTLARLRYWNQTAVDTSGLDHTPVAPGENRVFGEQFGPWRASRAMAIVHIAIFEALNATKGKYQSYLGLSSTSPHCSADAAIAQAAHDTLVALFPSQASRLDQLLAQDLSQLPETPIKASGVALGAQAAAAILARRVNDGSQYKEPHFGVDYSTPNAPGIWQEDPISKNTAVIGAYWGNVTPFVMTAGNQFRVPPPPALNSPEYAAAFNEAKSLGGDGVITPTTRTPEQTLIGTYWAYDGTPSLCAPPRMYNQITVHIATQMGTDTLELARLLALANTAMADAAIAVCDSKFYYQMWRPVTAIRRADEDGNPATVADPNFTPLGAPASNLNGPNFTPPFPACPSGHAAFGGAVFGLLRRYYGTDNISFTFVSDEFNGVTRDNQGNPRPLIPRSFSSLSQAEEENGQSRIYLGIHWAFDKNEGIIQGENVAEYVFTHAFQPVR